MILKFYIYTSELLRHHHLIANGTILLSLWQLHHTKLHRQRIVNQQLSNKKLPPRIYLIVSVAYKDPTTPTTAPKTPTLQQVGTVPSSGTSSKMQR